MTAQEIKYIDLSAVQQRTELRHPPASPATCEDGTSCVGGGSGGVSVVDGAPDQRDPHALGVYLMRVTPTDINPFEPFEAEFKVLNTGQVSLELPVSPYLSDLQPGDESLDFHYLSLSLVVVGEPEPGGPDVGGSRLHHAVRFTGLRWKCDSTASGRMDSCWTNMKVHTWPSEPVFAASFGCGEMCTIHNQGAGSLKEKICTQRSLSLPR